MPELKASLPIPEVKDCDPQMCFRLTNKAKENWSLIQFIASPEEMQKTCPFCLEKFTCIAPIPVKALAQHMEQQIEDE